MKNVGGMILVVAAAAAVGAALGVAYAPNKGVVTRKKLKKKVNRAAVDLKDYIDQKRDTSLDTISELVETGKEKAKELSTSFTKKTAV